MFKQQLKSENKIDSSIIDRGTTFQSVNLSKISSEKLFMKRVQEENQANKLLEMSKLPNTVDNFLRQSKIEKMSPIGKFLRHIRYDSNGKPIKRTICGTSDEFTR